MRSELVGRHQAIHFYRQKQQSRENNVQFLVELQRLAETCTFETFLEEVLRDHLVTVLQSDLIRCRLFALRDDEITWDRVDKGATAMEAAQDMMFDNNCASNAELRWEASQVKSIGTSKVP